MVGTFLNQKDLSLPKNASDCPTSNQEPEKSKSECVPVLKLNSRNFGRRKHYCFPKLKRPTNEKAEDPSTTLGGCQKNYHFYFPVAESNTVFNCTGT